MFSRRTQWSLAENDISQALAARRRPYLDLTETNPTHAGLPREAETQEILRALSSAESRHYTPAPFGSLAAREAVAGYHRHLVSPERVCLTASTSEGYSWLFKLLCDPGDRVLVPQPGYPLFDYLATLENVELGRYTQRAWDDWSVDFEQLRGQLTPLTRAIVLVSPSNPTGAALHEGDLPQLAELCRAHDLALICDEVFADYTTGSAARVPSLAGFDGVLTFVLSGLSKTCLLPQLKLGWIAVSGPPGATTEAVARLELIADSYLSVNTPVQVALPTILALRPRIQQRLIERLQANRAELVRATRGSPVSVLPSDGGWSAVLQVPRQLSEKAWVLEILEAANVLVHPGFFFDFETDGYLVLSLLVAEQSFGSGIAQLVRHVASRVR